MFNDILVYGIPLPATERYFFSFEIRLVKAIITDVPDNSIKMIKNAIEIKGTGKSFCIYFDTPEDKTKWMQLV